MWFDFPVYPKIQHNISVTDGKQETFCTNLVEINFQTYLNDKGNFQLGKRYLQHSLVYSIIQNFML